MECKLCFNKAAKNRKLSLCLREMKEVVLAIFHFHYLIFEGGKGELKTIKSVLLTRHSWEIHTLVSKEQKGLVLVLY